MKFYIVNIVIRHSTKSLVDEREKYWLFKSKEMLKSTLIIEY